MIPDRLALLVREHRDGHALYYPPHGNADHGPMACLALHGLGADAEAIERFATRYRQKLAPLAEASVSVTAESWAEHLGHAESYSALLAFFDAIIAAHGWRSVVGRYLPRLLSGAVIGAFHPLIRLAYGIEFQVPSEISAGLAFMTCTGGDVQLERAGASERATVGGAAYLELWQAHRDAAFSKGRFDERYRRVVEAVPLQPAGGAPGATFRDISRAGLEVFHATHDFFALHLVTGSHAFRVCAPWGGPHLEGLFSVAMAAAYLAIGAPAFGPLGGSTAGLPIRALHSATDDHDIKLAYSCREQARAYADSGYEWVAARYLAPRLEASAAPA